jgi:hypothetical protein
MRTKMRVHAGSRLTRLLISVGVIGGGVWGWAVPRAGASGPERVFQTAFSYGCQNHTLCDVPPFGIGGVRGSLTAYSDGTADGQVQVSFHSSGPLDEVSHSTSVSGYKSLDCSSDNPNPPQPDCFYASLEAPPDPNSQYLEFNVIFPQGPAPIITPATPGHYSVHTAPGAFKEVTVTAAQ